MSVYVPMQSSPPFAGGGSEHCLVLVWVPFSQVTSHADHGDQLAQFPSTICILKVIKWRMSNK
jgi:hypothetical protein